MFTCMYVVDGACSLACICARARMTICMRMCARERHCGAMRLHSVARSFSPGCTAISEPLQHNYEKGLLKCSWSATGSQVSAGSADNFVYVWDSETKRIKYKLPGHKGSVNEVDFHPTQPIISSCSNDKQIYLGEIRGL